MTLGYGHNELRGHLEKLFTPEMTWQNYGPGYKVNGKGHPEFDSNGDIIPLKQWHVDHIIPLSSFNIQDPEERKKANHYTNLQPLWSVQNIQKGNKLNWHPTLTIK